MARILIIDDDDAFREGLAETLRSLGHEVLQADRAVAGLATVERERPDAIFLDYRMPDLDGISALRRLKQDSGDQMPAVVMLTAHASGENTIEAMKLGAFDHLTKPIGRADVAAIVGRIVKRAATKSPPVARPTAGAALVGASPAIREVQKLIGLVAVSDATVLITGETGTGKELVARALHENSARAERPFVAVNCAAIPAELLESELFGHVRGAFSGATSDRVGHFKEAHGGTLLLDEIGDMSPAMQAKILRVLEEREVAPVGGGRPQAVDVRVIAATHRDLAAAVQAGQFRDDLLYRLNVIPIHLPPLRERPSDIITLADHFLLDASHGRKSLSGGASRALLAYQWPGNVRELKNLMARLSVVSRGNVVDVEDVTGLMSVGAPAPDVTDWLEGDLPTAVARLERALIKKALAESGGNRAEAARRLGINRQLLYSKMRDLGIE